MSTTPGGTVLLLEDDQGIRDLVSDILTDDGHEVRPCASPDEILDVVAATPAALAVVDFWGESQATLAAEEREVLADLARSVPTVLMTGRDWASEQVTRELGLAGLVRKPFDVAELSEVVQSCVEKAKADGEA